MADLIAFVFSLRGLILALFVVAVCFRTRLERRGLRRLLIGVAMFYGLSSVYVIPYALSRVLVWDYQPLRAAAPQPGRTAIVVLGAGEWPVLDWDDGMFPMLIPEGAARIQETYRVWRQYSDAWVISSGGVPKSGGPTSGQTMKNELVQLGVPRDRILSEEHSRTTREEAVIIAGMLPNLNVERVVLVTSDIHMRRSMGAFRAVGITPIPAMARDPIMALSSRTWAWPGAGLSYTGQVVHEFAGLAYYAARGWWR